MAKTKSIAVQTGAIFFGKALSLVIGIVRLNYIARYLGVANFGILNFAIYFVTLFSVLYDLGLPTILTREIARRIPETTSLLRNGLVLKAALILVATILIMAGTMVSGFDAITRNAIYLTLISLGLNSVSLVFLSAVQAHQRMILYSVVVLLSTVVNSIAVIAIIPSFPSIDTVLVIGVIVSVAYILILLIIAKRLFGGLRGPVDRTALKDFLVEGYPLALAGVGGMVILYASSMVLKYALGDTSVGIFSAAFKLYTILMLFPSSFTQVIYPILAGFYTGERGKLPKAFNDSLRAMATVSVPMAVGGIILAPKIIGLVYPPAFQPAWIVFAILIGSSAVGYLNWVISTMFVTVGLQRVSMWATLAVGALVLCASIIIVPTGGYVAAGAIIAGGDMLLFIWYFVYLFTTEYRIDIVSIFPKQFISTLAMAACLIPMRTLNLFVLVAVGSAIYAIMMFLIKGYGDQEKELLRAAFGNRIVNIYRLLGKKD